MIIFTPIQVIRDALVSCVDRRCTLAWIVIDMHINALLQKHRCQHKVVSNLGRLLQALGHPSKLGLHEAYLRSLITSRLRSHGESRRERDVLVIRALSRSLLASRWECVPSEGTALATPSERAGFSSVWRLRKTCCLKACSLLAQREEYEHTL